MLLHRTALAALAGTVIALAGADSALAVTTYRVSIEGTLTASGTVSTTRCDPDVNGGTLTGEARTSVRFRTTRPAILTAQRMTGGFPALALQDDRPIRATATIQRSSTLEDPESPRNCFGPSPEQDCGTRTLAFDIGMGSSRVGGKAGPAPDLSKNAFGTKPLFESCPQVPGMGGFPSITGGSGIAPVSAARMLSGRAMTLRGGRSESERIESSGVTGGGSYRLRYTITLRRP